MINDLLTHSGIPSKKSNCSLFSIQQPPVFSWEK